MFAQSNSQTLLMSSQPSAAIPHPHMLMFMKSWQSYMNSWQIKQDSTDSTRNITLTHDSTARRTQKQLTQALGFGTLASQACSAAPLRSVWRVREATEGQLKHLVRITVACHHHPSHQQTHCYWVEARPPRPEEFPGGQHWQRHIIAMQKLQAGIANCRSRSVGLGRSSL